MKILKHIIAFAFILGTSSMASAAIPPPPVNQNLGIPDTSFSNFSAELCQACHWASKLGVDPLSGAPVKEGYNPNRHHLVLTENTVIDGIPEFPPFRDADGDGVNDTHYSCLNCHEVNVGGFDIASATLLDVITPNYRNCLNCHDRAAGPLTVHHTTELAQTGFCFRCHGGLVRGIDVDTLEGKKPDPADIMGSTIPVDIPTYPTSMITPWRSKKPNGDGTQVNHAGIEPGNCNFCHNTASGSTEITGDLNGTLETVNLPDGSTFQAPILTNAQNHHNTGFYLDQKCAWCHMINNEFQTGAEAIRVCQRCHDRTTLHNIEFDAVGDGITPGAEDPYFGHIGNQANCWGCHGNNGMVQDANGNWVSARDTLGVENQGVVVVDENTARLSDVVTAVIPVIESLSTQSVSAGEEIKITLTGNNIVNPSKARIILTDGEGNLLFDENGIAQIDTVSRTWSSEVVVTDKNNNSITITPDYQDTNKLEFTLPATLTPGFYQVALKKDFVTGQELVDGKVVDKKDQHISNPIGLTVVPSIVSQQSFVYTPYGGLAILTGQNFMDAVKGFAYKIVDQNGQAPLAVYVWRDDLVVAQFAEIPESVTVEHILDKKEIPLVKF